MIYRTHFLVLVAAMTCQGIALKFPHGIYSMHASKVFYGEGAANTIAVKVCDEAATQSATCDSECKNVGEGESLGCTSKGLV